MLKPTLLSATAPGRSVLGTMSPTDACQAGPLNAVPQPMRKVKRRSSQGVISPDQAAAESTRDTASMKLCAASITRRRSKLSAIAPASSDSSMIGNVTEACTSATIPAESAMEVIIQDAPTDWMSPPKFDAMLANQTDRNTGWRSGERAEEPSALLARSEKIRAIWKMDATMRVKGQAHSPVRHRQRLSRVPGSVRLPRTGSSG